MDKFKILTIAASIITISNFLFSLVLDSEGGSANNTNIFYPFPIDSVIFRIIIFIILEIIISYIFVKIFLKQWRKYTEINNKEIFNTEVFVSITAVVLIDLMASAWTSIFNIKFLFLSTDHIDLSDLNKYLIIGIGLLAANLLYALAFSAEATKLENIPNEVKNSWSEEEKFIKSQNEDLEYLFESHYDWDEIRRYIQWESWDKNRYYNSSLYFGDSKFTNGFTINGIALAFVVILLLVSGSLI